MWLQHQYPTHKLAGANFAILGVCTALVVECYPQIGIGDCGGGEARSPNALKIDWRFWDFGSHGLVVMVW
ncbi:MAG: hypothetical protein ACYT04_64650 [Nostoc sp.]